MTTPKSVTLFNTLTRQTEALQPRVPGEIGLYCCGPTVYNYQHIGNLRTYIFEDVLVRTLRAAGYRVKHVMNITDVGHLVSDADAGEDKMALAARREGKTSWEIADFYTKIFFDHCSWLNIKRPDVVCKATDHIAEMIQVIKQLEEKGAAYLSGGNVYFDVTADADYGKLAGLDMESLRSGARVEVDSQKRNPLDFALWFTKSKFEKQEMQWDSPWGRGYPGWHIECSAMSMKYLGESFDLHCGGIDHIPVHHTNEIAQSETASGKPFVSMWLHGGFLVVGADKMSKSTGEFLTLDRLRERGLDPLAYRLFCYSASYRSELSWSWQGVEGAANTLKRWKQTVIGWRTAAGEAPPATETSAEAGRLREAFWSAVFSDLGMPKAIAVVHELLRTDSLPVSERYTLLREFDAVLGFDVEHWQAEEVEIPAEILTLVERRNEARKSRKFAEADALRAQIAERGYVIEDSKDGVKIRPA